MVYPFCKILAYYEASAKLYLSGVFDRSLVNVFQALTSTGIKKGEFFLADVSAQLKNKNITTDVKVDTNSNVSV